MRLFIGILLAILLITPALADVRITFKDGYPRDGAYVFVCNTDDFRADVYDWSFGDGEYLYDIDNQEIYHQYDSNGEFMVYCAATNNETTIANTARVHVSGIDESIKQEPMETPDTDYVQSRNYDAPNICWPDYECTEWTACVNGTKTRACTDRWSCETARKPPATNESCDTDNRPPILEVWHDKAPDLMVWKDGEWVHRLGRI